MSNQPKNRTSPQHVNQFSLALQKAYERFVRIRGTPHEIALGFALGLYVGMSPTIGLQTAIAVFLAALLKWNKISAAVGVWITNPLSAPIVYGITYLTGSKLLGVEQMAARPPALEGLEFTRLLQKTPEIAWILTVGGLVVGIPLALAGYYFAYKSTLRYQESIKRSLAKRRRRKSRAASLTQKQNVRKHQQHSSGKAR